jgi:Flp pilus assembly protein TadG
MVEFAMVFPVFLLLVLASVDYGGYFAARLSVENAARNAARWAATEVCPTTGAGVTSASNNACWTNAQPPAPGTIEAAAISTASDAHIINQDCPDSDSAWPPSATDLATLTPDTGCISIRYYDLTANQTQTCTGGPGTCSMQYCASWSAGGDQLQVDTPTYSLGTNCLIAATATGANIVQVLVGYNYQPTTPMPKMLGATMTTTSAETQLVLEQP